MSYKKDYYEKLKDPKWQRRRTEILTRDDFKCRSCMSEEKTLHVHHLCYFKGYDPWEYDDLFMVTLCEDCHEMFHNEIGYSEYFITKEVDLLKFKLETHEDQRAYDVAGILRYMGVSGITISDEYFEMCKLKREYVKGVGVRFKIIENKE